MTKKTSPQSELRHYLEYLQKQPKGFVYKAKKTHKKTLPNNKEKKLKKLFSQYENCQECPLATQGRMQVVFGHGNANATLMFVGEGPGRDEDRQGIPLTLFHDLDYRIHRRPG